MYECNLRNVWLASIAVHLNEIRSSLCMLFSIYIYLWLARSKTTGTSLTVSDLDIRKSLYENMRRPTSQYMGSGILVFSFKNCKLICEAPFKSRYNS